jgi:Ca-activated chloride channel family protein
MKTSLFLRIPAGLMLWLAFALQSASAEESNSPCGLCYANTADGTRIVVPLESTEVVLDVQPGLLEAQVTQTFTNRTATAIEATYLYPLPAEATLTQFELQFRDRVIRSVVREKKQARIEYEKAKEEGKKAALLEQHDPSLFSTAVANFLPGETVKVVIRFIQPVALSVTSAEIRFPMTTGVKYFPASATPGAPGNSSPTPPKVDAAVVSEHHYYAFDVLVNGFPPTCAIKSNSHAIRVEELGGGRRRVGLAEEITIPDRDFVLQIEPQVDAEPASTAVLQRTATGCYGMFTVFPPRSRAAATEVNHGRDILFLLDHSGSMNGPRMTSAKLGLQGCLGMLEPLDCFQIVVFDDTHSFYQPTWTPANAETLAAVNMYVGQIEAGGGTMMQPALEASLDFFPARGSGREQIVIFLTDGDVGNETELLKLLDAKIGRTRLFTFGIGAAPNAYLIGKMAERGRGQARFISDDRSIARELNSLFATLAEPVLTDLRLTLVDANDEPVAAAVYPRALRDVFMGCPVQAVFAAEGPEPAAVLLEAQRAGQPLRVRVPLQGAELRGDGLAKHFGRMLYEDLSEQLRTAAIGEGQVEALEKRKLATALRFQLVTELTSRVAVDREVSRTPEAVLTTTTVAQYSAADQGATTITDAGGEIIVLSPFEVAASETSGYTACDTLAGTRIRTELQDVSSSVTVVNAQFLRDLGAKRLEETVPVTGEPMENAVFARPGSDSGLIDGLPLSTVVDPNTVDRISVRTAALTSTELDQKRASFRSFGEVEVGAGDGGARNAKLDLNRAGDSDRWAGRAILSHIADEHERWSAYGDGRLRFAGSELSANIQWNHLAGYGRTMLGKCGLKIGQDSGTQLLVTAACQRLERDDPWQFSRGSATARYDGLGYFNLDLLTAPLRSVGDRIVQADLVGTMAGQVRNSWMLTAQWHRQTLDYVWPVAVPTEELGRESLQLMAGDEIALFGRHLHLGAHIGLGRHDSDGMVDSTRNTAKWDGSASWEFNRSLSVFVRAGHDEAVASLPSGLLQTTGTGWAAASLPIEHRDNLEMGCRTSVFDDRVSVAASFYRERIADSAFRDWEWESVHPVAVATNDGDWISPIRYGVCERLVREGWRAELNVQPLRNLCAVLKWYADWRNQGPVVGGNWRGMFFARYDFDCGYLKGFSLGGGCDYRNAVRFNDGYRLAGGVNWNLLLGYERRLIGQGPTRVQLTLRNLGGNAYQPTRFANDRGRQLLLSLTQEF